MPLCDRHHHLVHEGGWTLTLQPDRTITLQRPDGTISFTGTTADRTHPPDPTPHPTETDGRGLENNEAPTRPTAAGAGPTDVVTPTPPPANRLDPDEASTGPVDPDHPAADQPVRVPDWVFDLFDHRIERRPAAPTGPARAHTTAKTDRPVHTDRRVATRPLTSPTLSARPPP